LAVLFHLWFPLRFRSLFNLFTTILMKHILFSFSLSIAFLIACNKPAGQADTNATATPGTAGPVAASGKHTPYVIADSSRLIDLGEGLKLYYVEKGGGAVPKSGANVVINYHGMLRNGSVFDSSFDSGQVADFGLGNLIQGWQRALTKVPSGSKIVIIVPPALGYGAQSQSNIPANSTLIFDIDLLTTY